MASPLLFGSTLLDAAEVSAVSEVRGGSAAARLGDVSLPVSMIALPPDRTAPENASCNDFCSAENLEVFTDEIENSTMNSANSRVIMSAKDTSQRSPSSCSAWSS